MFSSSYPAMLKTLSTLLLLVILGAMQACGLPVEQGGSDGSSSDLDSGTGDARDPTIALGKTLIINVERLDGSSELGLGNISLVSLNSGFQEVADGSLPSWDPTRSESTGNIELKIESDYIEQINHVIKIRYSDNEIYYAILPYVPIESSTTAQITVNIFTHYLVKKLFEQIPDSDSLQSHLPCTLDAPVIDCDNQPRAKQDYLAMVNNAMSQFNLELSSSTVTQALDTLEQQDEIRQYAEFAITEMTQTSTPFAKGTMRSVTGLGFDNSGNVFSTPPPLVKNLQQRLLFAFTEQYHSHRQC